LLSDEAKRDLSPEAFAQLVRENPEDVQEIARALARPTSDPIVTARVMAPNGDELRLVYEAGRWRVDGTHIDRYGQLSPRQALMGFLRAYARKRYDMIMRYVPAHERRGEPEAMWGRAADKHFEGTTAEKLKAAWEGEQKTDIVRIVEAIQAALPNARIEESGDRAVMPYGGGGTVLFVREKGLWMLEDLE
jgi:hypothetical protein